MKLTGYDKLPVITISREYGAGGSSIAKRLSEELGIPWYDNDFVAITAKVSGYSEEEVLKEGEEISEWSNFLNKFLNNSVAYSSSHDAIFEAQKDTMLELAKNPCIIVGRCGNIILEQAGIPSFDIFLYADKDIRVERTKERLDKPVANIEKYVEKRDALRNNYYKAYTKENIAKAQDYNLCLDTGVIDYETCVKMIVDLLK